MKRGARFAIIFLIIALGLSWPLPASANSAEPPGFIILVIDPPRELSLTIEFSYDGQQVSQVLLKEKRAWEEYFGFYGLRVPISGGGSSHIDPSRADNLTLVAEYAGGGFRCPFPASALSGYNSLLTLDIKTQTLSADQPPWRVPLLVALRAVLTLLFESLVFLAFGYRRAKSWLVFFAVNLITQGGLNAMLTGPMAFSSYVWEAVLLLLLETVVLAVELAVFTLLVREQSKRRAAAYVVVANLVSLLAGGLLISFLPI